MVRDGFDGFDPAGVRADDDMRGRHQRRRGCGRAPEGIFVKLKAPLRIDTVVVSAKRRLSFLARSSARLRVRARGVSSGTGNPGPHERQTHRMQVFVRDNDVNGALRILKKKMQREGTFREMKRRRSYEKPSERRAREKSEAIRRYRKAMRKRFEREGY